jgi:magnesium and cobalt transporter
MNDDKPPSSHTPHKSWISRLGQLLTGEVQDQDELLDILKDAQEKHLLDSDALSMMEGVLQVAEMRVRDIMIPRVQMVVVPQESELEAILPLLIEFAHSRFPVIEDDKSKVVGVLIAKDLLAHLFDEKKLTVRDIMRPAYITWRLWWMNTGWRRVWSRLKMCWSKLSVKLKMNMMMTNMKRSLFPNAVNVSLS